MGAEGLGEQQQQHQTERLCTWIIHNGRWTLHPLTQTQVTLLLPALRPASLQHVSSQSRGCRERERQSPLSDRVRHRIGDIRGTTFLSPPCFSLCLLSRRGVCVSLFLFLSLFHVLILDPLVLSCPDWLTDWQLLHLLFNCVRVLRWKDLNSGVHLLWIGFPLIIFYWKWGGGEEECSCCWTSNLAVELWECTHQK